MTEKGSFGYINKRKKSQLIKTIVLFSIALTIFVAGYLLNKNSRNNVWTVVAVLMVLPSTKMLVSYIVLAPYHSVKKELYDKVLLAVGQTDLFYTDYVITSTEKSMGLSFIVVKGKEIIGLCMREKDNEKYISEYIEKLVKLHSLNCHVYITKEESKFMKAVTREGLLEDNLNDNDLEELKATLKSVMV